MRRSLAAPVVLLFLFCGPALADYPPHKRPPKPHTGYKGSHPVKPKYSYAYGIDDKHAGIKLNVKERRDGKFTEGEYVTKLPDGRNQKVSYHVNGKSGFVADVKYDGVARHPVPIKKPVKPGKYLPPKVAKPPVVTYGPPVPLAKPRPLPYHPVNTRYRYGDDDDDGYVSYNSGFSKEGLSGFVPQDIYRGAPYGKGLDISPYERSTNLFQQQFYQ
ncbi:cuticle protein 19-like [Amphibalanus amphitrite]|uniref:cuticle protein 19-like n=1 Tax=Amphibalanus amphitrite TaxID=1232801 RepID=UPI001C92003F|nr:cuticle protein 19-like [Amphibalanus amphitrite]